MLPPDDSSFDHRSLALESDIRELRISSLKRQLEVCMRVCASLTTEFQVARLPPGQRETLPHRLDIAWKEIRHLQLAIDMLQRQQMPEGQGTDQQTETRVPASAATD
jgi:hypothetical protein